MSKTVVTYIRYGDKTGYAKSHSTTEVPDYTDLSYKADKTDVTKIQNLLQDQINAANRKSVAIEVELAEVIDGLKNYVEKESLERLKAELLSNERLKIEKDFVEEIGDGLIRRIKAQCEIERNAIHQEIVAFRNIDINNDLREKLSPLSSTINKLVVMASSIQHQLNDLKQVQEEVNTIYRDICSRQDILHTQAAECNNLYQEMANSLHTIIPQCEKAKKIEENVIELRQQTVSTVNKRVSEMEALMNKQQNNFELMLDEVRRHYEEMVEKLFAEVEDAAMRAASVKMRSMSFWEKVKWFFSGRKLLS